MSKMMMTLMWCHPSALSHHIHIPLEGTLLRRGRGGGSGTIMPDSDENVSKSNGSAGGGQDCEEVRAMVDKLKPGLAPSSAPSASSGGPCSECGYNNWGVNSKQDYYVRQESDWPRRELAVREAMLGLRGQESSSTCRGGKEAWASRWGRGCRGGCAGRGEQLEEEGGGARKTRYWTFLMCHLTWTILPCDA